MSGRIWAVALFCSVFALLHCGGSVEVVPGGGGASSGGGGFAGRGHAGQSSGRAGNAGATAARAGAPPTDAGFDVYSDPGCPDVGAPVQVNACDAFSQNSGCPPGLGCYPFVEHSPGNNGCGVQTFGTECRPVGTGKQGDVCGGNEEDCASGYVCVVGSQPGKHCVQLCPVGVSSACSPGLICGDLDVEGFGVCS